MIVMGFLILLEVKVTWTEREVVRKSFSKITFWAQERKRCLGNEMAAHGEEHRVTMRWCESGTAADCSPAIHLQSAFLMIGRFSAWFSFGYHQGV